MDKVAEYIEQMTPREKTAYEIAKKQLGSSFHMVKSIGFIAYLKNLEKKSHE
jgi:hypothetical protein